MPETPTDFEELERQLHAAERERDAWKGKHTEHFRMASLLVRRLEEKLEQLRALPPQQAEKLRDLARQLECDEDEKAFEEKVRMVAKPPALKKPPE